MSRNKEKNDAVAKDLCQHGVCHSIPGDVRKPESVKSVVEETIKKFGKVDVLVNGAAGNFLIEAEKLSTNGFRTVFEIDALGTFNMS